MRPVWPPRHQCQEVPERQLMNSRGMNEADMEQKVAKHIENLNSLASQKTMCNERRTCCNDIMKLRCRKIDSMLCSIRKYHLSGTALVHTPFIHVTICPFICSYIHSSTPHIDKYFHLFSFLLIFWLVTDII